MNTNRIYHSKLTKKFYPLTEDGERIDLLRPVEVNLAEYDMYSENNSFTIYDKKPVPMLLGTAAKNFYVVIQSKNASAIKSTETAMGLNHKGYFKAVKSWLAFDNTGNEWKEETHAEEALCIEWLTLRT